MIYIMFDYRFILLRTFSNFVLYSLEAIDDQLEMVYISK